MHGMTLQLLAIIILPLTILLVAVTFGSIAVHQNAMRAMVGERDERAVRTAASALSEQISFRANELSGLAILLSANTSVPITDTLSRVEYLLPNFDNGLAVIDSEGKLLATQGDPTIWQNWETGGDLSRTTIFHDLSDTDGKPLIYPHPVNGTLLGLMSAAISADRRIVGAFSIDSLVQNALKDALPPGKQLTVVLLDSNRQALYQTGQMEGRIDDHPGVAEVLQGKSGTVYVQVGNDEHVTAYSPVASPGWALITEESWASVSTPTLRTTQITPLVLVPALLIMVLALWFGARQVVQPLRALESKASTLAWGNFKAIEQPVGGIAEIQHLQDELIHMAHKVQEAQQSLHGYIGAITVAQEDERRRLARELHDDTLQALIALKQRVQLVQLKQNEKPTIQALAELETMIEQAINDLRRLTRALRPIYLEDLGLVAALEMLARETGQAMKLTVEFQHQGVEKRLDPAIELAFYRIAQEALSNVTRHALASRASLSITFTSQAIAMRVTDDGIGFEVPKSPAEFAPSGHYGLLGLHERAELIGAKLVIQSSPGKGTVVMVSLSGSGVYSD